MTHTLVPAAILRGAVVAVVVCGLLALFTNAFVPFLIGFALAGWVAGRAAPGYPYSNGALAALVGFAVLQAIAVLAQLADDKTVKWGEIVATALLASGAGMTGGLLAERRARRDSPS